MLVFTFVSSAAYTLGNGGLYVVRHVLTIVFLSKGFVHAFFNGIFGYWRMMCEV